MIQNRPSFLVTELVTNTKFMTITTHFYLNNYKRKDGRCQIFYDVSINGERDRIPTGLYISPDKWDNTVRRVKKKFDTEDINLSLDNMESKTTEIRTHYRLSRSAYLDIKTFRNEFFNKTPKYDFISFAKHHLETSPIKETTKRMARSVIAKLEEYKNPIPFSNLSLGFFEDYKGYLYTKGNKSTTIAGNIKTIKKFINLAKKHNLFINFDVNDLKVGSMKGSKTNLTIREVEILKQYYFSENTHPDHILTLGYFLFACYTSLRISEIQRLKRIDFRGDAVTFHSEKTDKPHTIVLNNTAKLIIERHPSLFVTKITPEYINRTLKNIMKLPTINIKKNVSMHTGRHTFATNFLRKGGNVRDLQQILNHSSILTTMIYVHIIEKESNMASFIMD
ncbi:tyrosine-type recombinase/integrase [Chryseobacterium caseinilyticum]|nr:tyrosine-type recombinase/integrase [Chryseobacterium caseinilyticum]